jgi:hypothetical protein
MAVYHHHYDLSLFIAPVLLAWFGTASLRHPSWAVWLTLPLMLMLAIFPAGAMPRLLLRWFGAHSVGWFNLGFPVATLLALGGSLAVLAQWVRRSAAAASLDFD